MKKALLVGINTYKDAELRGCVNDVVLMYKIISEKFGFDRKNIQVLTDYEATKQNIVCGIKNLVKGTNPGDTIFFQYSGHGSQVVVDDWTNNDEPDGRDEIICPIDLNWNDPLRDNQLGAFFKLLPKGVKVLVLLDSCNSGTGLRNVTKLHDDSKSETDWVNRFLPPPPSNILLNSKINIDDDLNFLFPSENTRSIQSEKGKFMVETIQQGNAILLAGCEDGQTSADAWMNNRYQGAMTYMLAQTLVDVNFKISYGKLIEIVNNKMDKMSFTQNPQLECKKEYFDNNFLG